MTIRMRYVHFLPLVEVPICSLYSRRITFHIFTLWRVRHPSHKNVSVRSPKKITAPQSEGCPGLVFPFFIILSYLQGTDNCANPPQNEDCGQMSAWYLFSALGFYPVDPVSGNYVVGTYVFSRTDLALSLIQHIVLVGCQPIFRQRKN